MITYTRAEKEGKPATYDCGLCGHFAEDVDGARAHQAVHVAGPELLAALHGLGVHPDAAIGFCFCINETQIKNGHAGECREARAAIAKAEQREEYCEDVSHTWCDGFCKKDGKRVRPIAPAILAELAARPDPENSCPPGCEGCGCASTPHPPCGHCESHQTPEGA